MTKIKKHRNINVYCKKCIEKERIEKLKHKRKAKIKHYICYYILLLLPLVLVILCGFYIEKIGFVILPITFISLVFIGVLTIMEVNKSQ
jgi:hypothetical protein